MDRLLQTLTRPVIVTDSPNVGDIAVTQLLQPSNKVKRSVKQIPVRKLHESGHPETKTLVVYVFSATDPEYINNLNFFIHWGIHDGDGADYVVVLQAAFPLN